MKSENKIGTGLALKMLKSMVASHNSRKGYLSVSKNLSLSADGKLYPEFQVFVSSGAINRSGENIDKHIFTVSRHSFSDCIKDAESQLLRLYGER